MSSTAPLWSMDSNDLSRRKERIPLPRFANDPQQFDELMPTAPLYLGLDLGGTNVKAGVVDDQGTPLASAKLPTLAKQGPQAGVEQIAAAGHSALAKAGVSIDDIAMVGLATPGTMDIPSGMLLEPPNLPGWDQFPIRQRVEEAIGRRTILQNDANAAAYGEFWAGSGRDAASLVMYTLGTGLGGGIIIGDTIVEGCHSHGSECGHVIIDKDNGRLCKTGQYGTLEAYCSATALIAEFEQVLATHRETSVRARVAAGEKLTPILIAEEAETGDEVSEFQILEMARYLGIGMTTVLHVIDPEMVVLGGAMTFGRNETALGRRFLERVREEVRARAFPAISRSVLIDYASLGSDAGFIGAAGCARLAHRKSPS